MAQHPGIDDLIRDAKELIERYRRAIRQVGLVTERQITDTPAVPDREDENQHAVRQVEKTTESEPVRGEDLLESEDLKRQLAEAKRLLEMGLPQPRANDS